MIMARFIVLSFIWYTLCLSTALVHCRTYEVNSNCPCQEKRLCDVPSSKQEKELFVFSTESKQENWMKYKWDQITTVAVYGQWNPKLMCFAHAKGAKVVIPGFFPTANLTNASQRNAWINATIQKVLDYHADGINFDIEGPALKDTKIPDLITEIVADTTKRLRRLVPNAQVTFDVAWSPDCIDNRCYDFYALSLITDFLITMSYDERSQVRGKCIAGANSGYHQTKKGIAGFIELGIPASKLVLALPLYGYDYTCIKKEGDECYIKHYDQFGVNCSDAVGKEKTLSVIYDQYLPKAIGGVKYDNDTKSMYFTYLNKKDNKMHQIWFDSPKTLSIKYNSEIANKLHGKSMFTADSVSFGPDPTQIKLAEDTWKSIYHD